MKKTKAKIISIVTNKKTKKEILCLDNGTTIKITNNTKPFRKNFQVGNYVTVQQKPVHN